MPWLRKRSGDPLAVSMSSIKLGDRLLVVGCGDTTLIATLAIKAGLTGRTCMVDKNEAVSSRAAFAVEREGALVEGFTAPYTALPFEAGAFDVAVVRNVFRTIAPDHAPRLAAEVNRVLRPGGRCIVIDGDTRGGLLGVFRGKQEDGQPASGTEAILSRANFRGVRTLAQREGLVFVEGVKPGT